MSRVVVIDANVIHEINAGNVQACEALKQIIKNGGAVRVTPQVYKELVEDPGLPRTATANRILLEDLGIRKETPAAGTPLTTKVKLSQKDALVANQTKMLGAELWSFDGAFKDGRVQLAKDGLKIAPETVSVPAFKGATKDYRVGRQLMGLPPVEISVKGEIKPPKGSTPAAGGPTVPPGGGSASSTSAKPIDPMKFGGAIRGQARGHGAMMVLGELNHQIGKLAGEVQAKRADEAIRARWPEIERLRLQDRTKGVIIRLHFSQIRAHGDSALTPAPVFQTISITTAHSLAEAGFAARIQSATPGTVYLHQDMWFEPLDGESLDAIWTPFPRRALATFAEGRATLQRVVWSGVFGFDDGCQLPVPNITSPELVRFHVLRAPPEIGWLNGSHRHKTNIPVVERTSANGTQLEVVDLDPWVPFGTCTAALVFPANRYTARLLGLGATHDNLGQLDVLPNFGRVRWVRPENLKVIEG